MVQCFLVESAPEFQFESGCPYFLRGGLTWRSAADAEMTAFFYIGFSISFLPAPTCLQIAFRTPAQDI
jgi:hypothetical protein